jgi:hypothetical protein
MQHRRALVTALTVAGVVLVGAVAIGANVGILGSGTDSQIGRLTPVDATLRVPASTASTATSGPVATATQQGQDQAVWSDDRSDHDDDHGTEVDDHHGDDRGRDHPEDGSHREGHDDDD